MKSQWKYLLLGLFIATLTFPASATISRYTQYLDGGVPVTVDNASGWSQSEVWNLVLAADRSTREECVYSAAAKGLFQTGDRIFVNQNYIAWFDFTRGDGVAFSAPYSNNWTRSGELAGFWSLNPDTHLFRYYRTGPNGCFNWPANELIAGSASANGGQYWWDAYSPGFEHAIGVNRTDGSGQSMYMAFNYVQGSNKSGFQQLLDGFEDGAGVHYKQKGRLTSTNGTTDILDNDDTILSNAYINSEQEYICRTNDILSIFRVQPTVNVVKNNLVIGLWVAYGQDVDNLQTTDNPPYVCDAGGPGEQWPPDSYVTKRPRYGQFSQTAIQNWTGTNWAAYSFIPHTLGPACPDNANYFNYDIYTPGAPTIGSFIRFGYHPTIDISEPRWQMLLLGAPNTGSGTQTDPINLVVGSMLMGNERRDGTVGGGIIGSNEQTLEANKWYQVYVSVQTNF
jgi:hypothetical protein